MATITAVATSIVAGVQKYTFTPMTFTGTDVTADVLDAPDWPFKEVQVFGTFGAGGNVAIEGSLDGGTTWAVLNDIDGTALNVTSPSLVRVRETVARIRARVTAGDGTTSLTVVIAMKSGGAYGS